MRIYLVDWRIRPWLWDPIAYAVILLPATCVNHMKGPLDFEEFCWAMGEELLAETIRKSFERLVPLPDALHKRAMRLWREYLLVGGMPQAVADYVEHRDFGEVDSIKRGILQLYSDDIGKFANGDAFPLRFQGSCPSMRNDSLWHRSIRGLDLVNTIRRSSGWKTPAW